VSAAEAERRRRWRLVLGEEAAELGQPVGDDLAVDRALSALYDADATHPDGAPGSGPSRSGGLGASAPSVARWLGDIRSYFPSSVVQVVQRDAVERLDLTRLLLEPELLEAVEPDVHLVGTLLSLSRVLPEQTKDTARRVVRTVVEELERRLADRTRSAVTGALDRSTRTHRPRLRDIDWDRTIRRNLQHYLPEHRTLVPERLVGHGRAARAVHRDVVLAVDQSGSMASSVVYASVFGAVLASMRSLRTSLVVFDTAVVDLTDKLADPVDVLFGAQLGGGTDINRAIAYCQGLVTRPTDTVFVLVSDLYEGGVRDEMLRRVRAMLAAGVQVVVLLALSDEGAPAYDHDNAAALSALGAPAFACTPDAFPDLMAAAISRSDLAAWAERSLGVRTHRAR
jgi:Mg-chelatase subunit ChlD